MASACYGCADTVARRFALFYCSAWPSDPGCLLSAQILNSNSTAFKIARFAVHDRWSSTMHHFNIGLTAHYCRHGVAGPLWPNMLSSGCLGRQPSTPFCHCGSLQGPGTRAVWPTTTSTKASLFGDCSSRRSDASGRYASRVRHWSGAPGCRHGCGDKSAYGWPHSPGAALVCSMRSSRLHSIEVMVLMCCFADRERSRGGYTCRSA